MTRFNDITNSSDYQSKINYIDRNWRGWSESRLGGLSRITNYLFVLNTGGLLATVTYIASKSANDSIQMAMWIFVGGIVFSVAHATLDYYLIERSFTAYRDDVNAFLKNDLDWEVLVDRNAKRPPLDSVLHILGWIGGASFFIGLAVGLCQIPGA